MLQRIFVIHVAALFRLNWLDNTSRQRRDAEIFEDRAEEKADVLCVSVNRVTENN